MAEPISIQQLKDASLDVKSLEEVVNGDENVVVTTRLGETYPSVKGSIKKVFETGGLPATPFATKALMEASNLVNGDYAAVVFGDTSGVYVKTAGVWVLTDLIKQKSSGAVIANIIPSPDFSPKGASPYQGSVAIVDGEAVLSIEANRVAGVIYTIDVLSSKHLKHGDTIELSASYYTDGLGSLGSEIGIQALSATGVELLRVFKYGDEINNWKRGVVSLKIPPETTTIKLRFMNRGAAIVKFKNPVLTTTNEYVNTLNLADASGVYQTVYVKKTGNDTNSGTMQNPKLTIQAAIDSVVNSGGRVVVLDSDIYRESVKITTPNYVAIEAAKGEVVNIFGSSRLEVSKKDGYINVNQANLSVKPIPTGVNRPPLVFEMGKKSKLVEAGDEHHLHRGQRYRLPYTAMQEVTSIAEVEAELGTWFWEGGVIYLSSTDGGDATTKSYEVRERASLEHSGGIIELTRVNSWFSSSNGMSFTGLKTIRTSCKVYGARSNGFSDNASVTLSTRDISGGNGNDGFNITPTVGGVSSEGEYLKNRCEGTYTDPYGHDNMDDGISCHQHTDSTVIGGLFEYNVKADVIHVTGANCVCYGTYTRGTATGFQGGGGGTTRDFGYLLCKDTVSMKNNIGYILSHATMVCDNATAISPTERGFSGIVGAKLIDCNYFGDPSKMWSGNPSIINTSKLV